MYLLKKGANIRRTVSTDRRDALVKLGWQEVAASAETEEQTHEEPKEQEDAGQSMPDLQNMVKDDLLALAKEIGLTVPMGIKKDDLLAMLEAHYAKG